MKIILLAGGAGTRLWPLSTGAVSKQYLALMKDADGRRLSMLQHTIARLKSSSLLSQAVVSTSAAQLPLIRAQLGTSIACVVEPERRDTFPAISLACSYLFDQDRASGEEIVIVLPVDAGADAAFYASLTRLAELLGEPGAPEIGLVGVRPTSPSSQYGYILSGKQPFGGTLLRASGFKEKPDEALAEQLIAEGALWNCGVFGFRLSYFLNLLASRGYPTSYKELHENFPSLPARSFDYEVLEQEPRIGCLRHDGPWKDLGTWHAIADDLSEPMNGFGIIDEASSGTTVLNELKVPVLVSGLKDAIVVAGQEGILICAKSAISGIKPLVRRLNESEDATPSIPGQGMQKAQHDIGFGTLELDRGPSSASSPPVVTKLHRLPRCGVLHAEADGRCYVWTLTAGSGTYISAEGDQPALLGVPYVGPAGASFLADADAQLVETTTCAALAVPQTASVMKEV
ncbi:sugar phosphate nucleotidyltransferase [Cohnella sp. GCM10020058]|uniref:sugar phosphate nucleotidyltransferase n=1 Tax=Cohnella sp. GCM10020058 TaxID=3317330 RepID=UPI00363F4DC8